jgi:hypothetical protein
MTRWRSPSARSTPRRTATCRSRAARSRCWRPATWPGALQFARAAAGNEPSAPDDPHDSDDELLIAALTGDVAGLERGLAALERSSPGVLLGYRTRLRELCGAGGVAPLGN